MITAAQLRKAAILLDTTWVNDAPSRAREHCAVSAMAMASGGVIRQDELAGLQEGGFKNIVRHNDAPDCTKDAAVMFLLLCAEAREHGDL